MCTHVNKSDVIAFFYDIDFFVCVSAGLIIFFLLTLKCFACAAGQVKASTGAWRERLRTWKEIIEKEKLSQQLDSLNAKYVVDFDMKEVENSLRKDVVEKVSERQGTRALWISKRWWRYRPKLPYTYFLDKLDSSEVKCGCLFLTSYVLTL